MQFSQIDENNIYIGMIEGIKAISPDKGYYTPQNVKVSFLGKPPTNELNKWKDNGTKWVRVALEDIIQIYDTNVETRLNSWAILHQYKGSGGMTPSERLLSYESSTIPKWKFEASNFRKLWDNTWLWLQNYLNTKMSETTPTIPTWEEVETLLNENVPLVWPEYNE